ncbi:hypothetical protein FB45DRAFT_873781 [Roridomyces roridus]|uniref:Amine oxidase domain-containing protein n=1 Tax=Roridomyces roridus TaxID=1738132 RepID=A0AAD7BAS3_9AGAR|nr:hypothetical protein FB45DRAFT_873781 [Roridomyces roridus]
MQRLARLLLLITTAPLALPASTAGTTQNDKTVLILGGVAGIIAACNLTEQKVTNFLILEARDELGGRMHSMEFGGSGRTSVIELGANWIRGEQEGTGPANPIYTLAQKYGLKAVESDFYESVETYDETGKVDYLKTLNDAVDAYTNLTVVGGGRVPTQQPQTAAERVVEYYVDWKYAQTPEQTSWTASSWVRQPHSYRHTLILRQATNFTYDVDQGGFSDSNLLSIDQRGFKYLIQSEASPFLQPSQVLVNAIITNIAYSSDAVVATLANGTKISSDYAISTFSVGVLQHDDVAFEPMLPLWKQEAIQSMTMATYTKLFLQFDEKFWFDTQFALYADKVRGRYPVWQSLDLDGFLPDSGRIFATVTHHVPQYNHPNTHSVLLPAVVLRPALQGKLQQLARELRYSNLRANLGRLWFSGEAMSQRYFGFLHGAYFEGMDAGQRVAHTCEDKGEEILIREGVEMKQFEVFEPGADNRGSGIGIWGMAPRTTMRVSLETEHIREDAQFRSTVNAAQQSPCATGDGEPPQMRQVAGRLRVETLLEIHAEIKVDVQSFEVGALPQDGQDEVRPRGLTVAVIGHKRQAAKGFPMNRGVRRERFDSERQRRQTMCAEEGLKEWVALEEGEHAPPESVVVWWWLATNVASRIRSSEEFATRTAEMERGTHFHIYGGAGGPGGAGDQHGGEGGSGEGGTLRITNLKAKNQDSKVKWNPSIFQGRKDILDKMQQYFAQEPKKRRIFVLHGLGGSGKTQKTLLMIENFSSLMMWFFVNASSPEALKTSLTNIGISQSFGKTPEAGLQWLISENKEWTLLFDNADDPKLNLSSFFPQCTHGNIIITSRNPKLATYGPASHSQVGDLDTENAALLLLARAVKEHTDENYTLAMGIVQELSCLPLAIVQAGAYIAKFKCLKNYLSIYRKNKEELLQQHPDQTHDNYEWTVYTTWEISFRKLSPVAARFLQLCSLLHHSNIPESIFAKATQWILKNEGNDTESLQEARKFLQNFVSGSGRWSKQYFRNIVAEIEEYSLIQSQEASDTLDMHPLVHLWCSSTLPDEVTTRACMANVVGMSIDLGPDAYLERIRMIAHVNMLVQDFTVVNSQFWRRYARVYYDGGKSEQAKGLCELILQRQRELLGEHHPNTLRAMANLAATYRKLGRYREAEPLEISVLKERQRLLGDNHPDTLLAMANLAATYWQLGRYREAEPLQVSVLKERQKLLGEDHPDTLLAMANLAITYQQLGRYREAEPLQVSVLKEHQKLLGDNHPETLRAMANLAVTYRQLGRYREAEPLEISVLEQRQKLLGDDHPDTLLAMANLAVTYGQLGRYREAEPLEISVLEQRQKLLGDDHPDTLLAMANLAVTYGQLGRYREAEPLEISVLEQRQKLLGDDHPDTLLAMANLAVTYEQLGRYREAEPLEISVLEQRQTLLGDDHPEILRAMANLAATYRQLGQYREAEPLQVSVLKEHQKLLGDNHPETLRAMANLAVTYGQLGRYREAEPLKISVLEQRQKLLGDDHPDTLLAMANLAVTYGQLGRYREAEPLEISVLEQLQKLLGDDHPDTLLAMANLAVTYGQLGRYREAEPLEISVLEQRQRLLGDDHPKILRAMANLAATYRQLGQYREAEPLQVSVLKEHQKLLGDNHPETLRAMANLAVTYGQLGRYREAEPLEISVLEQCQKLLGDDHPDTLLAMANLAVTYGQLGRYREAEPLEISVLEQRQKLFGDDHPETLRAMANLAATYRQLGQYREAESLLLSGLEQCQKLLGEDHPDTLAAMANLAFKYWQLGRYQEAESLYISVLERRQKFLGEDHPETLNVMADLALTLRSTGRHQAAENLQLKVVAKLRDVLGADHPYTVKATQHLKAIQDALESAKPAKMISKLFSRFKFSSKK